MEVSHSQARFQGRGEEAREIWRMKYKNERFLDSTVDSIDTGHNKTRFTTVGCVGSERSDVEGNGYP